MRIAMRTAAIVLASVGEFPAHSAAQIAVFPYAQGFDSVSAPALPAGWTSTQHRSPGRNDFETSAGTPHSPPNALLATNATIGQSVTSPAFDFSGVVPDSLSFFTRRSGSFLAGVVVESSTDTGEASFSAVGDTLFNAGTTAYRRTAIGLPAGLGDQKRVRFRWRILPDSTGASGTFRLDDVLLSVRPRADLALSRMRLTPDDPVETDAITVLATVRNFGVQDAQSFAINIFEDSDRDGLPDPEEILGGVTNTLVLPAGDSMIVSIPLGTLRPLECTLIGVLDFPSDENSRNDTTTVRLDVGCRPHCVAINEIMYAPAAPEPEWIELFSLRGDTLSLRRWWISDAEVTSRHLLSAEDVPLPPHGFLLLTRDSAALLDVHPDIACPVVGVPGFPSLNNGGDAVVVYDRRGVTIDSIAYIPSWGGNAGGSSLERIDPWAGSTMKTNWGSSRGGGRGSPGERNTIARRDRDLRMDTVFSAPANPGPGDPVTLSVRVTNAGFQDLGAFATRFFEDTNDDSLAEPWELRWEDPGAVPIAALESREIRWSPGMLPGGVHRFVCVVASPGDEDPTNDTSRVSVVVAYGAQTMRINELMYAPLPGLPEWVELMNISRDTLDLQNWKVGNRTSRYRIAAASLWIPPAGLCLLTKDSAALVGARGKLPAIVVQIPSLPSYLWNNSSDAAVLSAMDGAVIDSVAYVSFNGALPGISLERIDPFGSSADTANWGMSVDTSGSTPGRFNSIGMKEHDLAVSSAQAFACCNGSGATVTATVRNRGRQPSARWSLALYDDADHDSIAGPGELLSRTVVAATLAPRDTVVVRVGTAFLEAGMHNLIVAVEDSLDERAANNTAYVNYAQPFGKNAAVINEIMYEPFPGDAEYVEFLNPGKTAVDIDGWRMEKVSLSGAAPAVYMLSEKSFLLGPGEFLVLAGDSALFRRFPATRALRSGDVVTAGKASLQLRNDGDVLVLRDAAGAAMDSVAYQPGWHNPSVVDRTGRSLERIQPLSGSNDGRNWSTCVLLAGGTPGARNSVFTRTAASRASLSFAPNPFSPDGDGREDFVAIHYELPLRSALISIRIFDIRGRLVRTLASGEPAGQSGEVLWDGLDDNRVKARIGIYVVLLEAIDDRGGVVISEKGAVVLAGIL